MEIAPCMWNLIVLFHVLNVMFFFLGYFASLSLYGLLDKNGDILNLRCHAEYKIALNFFPIKYIYFI